MGIAYGNFFPKIFKRKFSANYQKRIMRLHRSDGIRSRVDQQPIQNNQDFNSIVSSNDTTFAKKLTLLVLCALRLRKYYALPKFLKKLFILYNTISYLTVITKLTFSTTYTPHQPAVTSQKVTELSTIRKELTSITKTVTTSIATFKSL